jgi:hypothetical protein
MWWECCPLGCPSIYPDAGRLTPLVIDVLETILALPSPACQESALHGLGHLSYGNQSRVHAIIDCFLSDRGEAIDPRLRTYAVAAREGRVL